MFILTKIFYYNNLSKAPQNPRRSPDEAPPKPRRSPDEAPEKHLRLNYTHIFNHFVNSFFSTAQNPLFSAVLLYFIFCFSMFLRGCSAQGMAFVSYTNQKQRGPLPQLFWVSVANSVNGATPWNPRAAMPKVPPVFHTARQLLLNAFSLFCYFRGGVLFYGYRRRPPGVLTFCKRCGSKF